MTEQSELTAELKAVERLLKCDKKREIYCPISLFERDGFWIAVGWYDGANRFFSVMSTDKEIAVDVIKYRVRQNFPFYDSFVFEEPVIEDGDPPYHEKTEHVVWEESQVTEVSRIAHDRFYGRS